MNKKEFLTRLSNRIKQLPNDEVKKHINYYSKLIDKYIVHGLSEEDAIALLGSEKEIVDEILLNTSIFKIMKSFFFREDGRKMDRSGKIITIVTAPLWIIFYLIVFLIYIIASGSLWILIVLLNLILLVFGYSGVKIILVGITKIFTNIVSFTAYIGLGLILIGLTMIFYDLFSRLTGKLNKYQEILELRLKRFFILRR